MTSYQKVVSVTSFSKNVLPISQKNVCINEKYLLKVSKGSYVNMCYFRLEQVIMYENFEIGIWPNVKIIL